MPSLAFIVACTSISVSTPNPSAASAFRTCATASAKFNADTASNATFVSFTAFLRTKRRARPSPRHDAQEKPPDPHDDALEAPHGSEPEPPAPAIALANVECCLATSRPPHFGHAASDAPAPTRWSTSNRVPHPWQTYSYNGIVTLHNWSRESPRCCWEHPPERPGRSSRSPHSSGTARAATLRSAPAVAICRTRGTAPPAPCRRSVPSLLQSRFRLFLTGRVRFGCLRLRRSGGTACGVPGCALTRAAGRVGHRSGGHPELRQHHPLNEQPGRQDSEQDKGVAHAAHLCPASIAARPCSISRFSALTCRSSESHTVAQIAKTVGSSIR